MAETSKNSQLLDWVQQVGPVVIFVALHQLDVFGFGLDVSCVPSDQVAMLDLRFGPWVLRIGANR